VNNAPVFSCDFIGRAVYSSGGRFFAIFQDYVLTSAFQPIYSLSHKRVVGYEALLRAKDNHGQWVSPQLVFSRQEDEASIIYLDRLCRCVHANNFATLEDDVNWLFLNVDPQVVVSGTDYGPYFGELLDLCGIPPHRVVIEVVERAVDDQDRLVETADYYKSLGCLLAIDDFGAGQSNFERIWSLNPHIVKLDRSMVCRASTNKRIRNLMSGIVSLLHQAGSLVLMEGIETEEEAMIAMDSDVDFVQGFFFAQPAQVRVDGWHASRSFERLFAEYKKWIALDEAAGRERYAGHLMRFMEVAAKVRSGERLDGACSAFFEDPDVLRCFLLMPDGSQVGKTVVSPLHMENADPRFRPLDDASSADWFRRHYLKRALIHPEQLQITRPYLSITGAHMCTTLSMMISTPKGGRVLCCDINCD
jgi:EAL domain-containing protein (putative c-di-GMP-specific phosphodiesterase class I)